MDKKKILIVCRGFYPMNSPRSFRATELAKEFARQGHDVTVLTPKNYEVHPKLEEKFGFKIKDLGQPKFPDIKISKNKLLHYPSRALNRLLSLFFEYPSIELMWLVKKALKNENGYDLLISIAVPYPIHWGVAWARNEKHKIAKTWVADCGDPYYGQENDSFKVPFYFKYIEKWFCRKADFITVPTEGAVNGYFPEFHNKIKIIPQGFKFEEYQFEASEQKNTKPTFAYAGMFIPGRRDPKEFIEYLLSMDKDFEFHIYTGTKQLVEKYIPDSKGKILVHDVIARDEILKKLNQMDFVVNFENVGNKQTPSKLIDYAILKKPILSIKTEQLDKENVLKFLNGDYSGQYIVENVDQYRIENVCSKFLELV
uniref:Glycosyltransferase subfamily 4-like N-terminal domain-containing protein n=1 Tax=Ignavibacterium album TaxID=591197 RepID=A0A832D334_9BACT